MTEAAVSFAGNLTGHPEVRYTEDGTARSEVVAEELGPSLRWATATTTRATRSQDQ
jgi:single-stranded DNA-binding protein